MKSYAFGVLFALVACQSAFAEVGINEVRKLRAALPSGTYSGTYSDRDGVTQKCSTTVRYAVNPYIEVSITGADGNSSVYAVSEDDRKGLFMKEKNGQIIIDDWYPQWVFVFDPETNSVSRTLYNQSGEIYGRWECNQLQSN